jgi:hypothetical protein
MTTRAERLRVALSWLVVGIPAAWGVFTVATRAVALWR